MTGVLAIWNNVDQDNEAEFNEWYIRQHIPERVGVPGFLSGRRHLALSSADPSCPRNFTFYEVESTSVLTSDAYVERLNNPTEWTQRTMPWLLDISRTACQVDCAAGAGHGAFAGTMQLSLETGADAEFTAFAQAELLPALTEQSGVVSAQLWQADPANTNVATTERGLRPGEDQSVGAAIMVSATHAGALVNASALLPRNELEVRGATPLSALHLFQLIYALHAGPQ